LEGSGMKKIIILLLISSAASAQNKTLTYEHVDTVIQYTDADVIINKGIRDTVWYAGRKFDLHFKKVDLVIIYDEKLKKKK
jgi:uncharacterized protein YijF (DUF1287 family)